MFPTCAFPLARWLAPFRCLAVLPLLASCSASRDPLSVSVLYSNRSTSPGTAIVTWLTPGTATTVEMKIFPCEKMALDCFYAWYGPGFRTDTVSPNTETCVHFVAPGGAIAVEARITWTGVTEDFPAGHPTAAWSSDSAWGFDGLVLQPAGTMDTIFTKPGTVIRGC